MALTVTTSSSCVVRPSSPTPPHHMFLPAADIFWRHFHYNQRILFFGLADGIGFDFAVSRLKSSLASALVPFFPFAGRVFQQDGGRLALDCNDAGVCFIEACIDLPFSSLQNDGFKHQPFFRQLAPHGDVKRWTGPELPLLSVQVTRFCDDEGFVLGIGYSHIVADGASFWHFMKSWSECGRGGPLSVQPVHMREALGPKHLVVPPSTSQEAEANAELSEGSTNSVQCDFHFTSEMLKKLKNMATASCPSGHAPFSSLQSLGAHIWKSFLAATDEHAKKKCIFFVMSNMRSRLEPPLPEAYFGNAVIRDGTVARKEEVIEESIGATALRIQELVKKIDDKLFKTFYRNFEVLPFSKLLDPEIFTMVELHVSSSPRFPVYDVDFGWGPPLLVRSPYVVGKGEMVWFCGKDEGSIDVAMALPKPVMESLKQDGSFLSF